jgi:hypothetical protein
VTEPHALDGIIFLTSSLQNCLTKQIKKEHYYYRQRTSQFWQNQDQSMSYLLYDIVPQDGHKNNESAALVGRKKCGIILKM